MSSRHPIRELLRDNADVLFFGVLFAVKLAVHLPLVTQYGYHGDELYFIDCARHLAFGYVDHAPLVPWIARLSGEVFGYGLASLRLFPVLAGAASIVLTALLAKEWGGGRSAQLIAAMAVLVAPAYLQMASFLNIPVFETLIWTLAAYLITHIIKRDAPKWWILVGFVAGIGLLNKHTMLLWGFALGIGLLLTEHRRQLKSPWLWMGAAVALLIFLPNLIWQHQHEWATLQFIGNIRTGTLAAIPHVLFLLGQLLYMHPLVAPLWLAGLVFLFSSLGRPYRLFGWLYLVAFAVLLSLHGKPYYLAPAYPPLFAAGAIGLEQVIRRRQLRWGLPCALGALSIAGALTAPLALPILPLETSDRIIGRAFAFAIDDPTLVTGDFHLQHGWAEQAAAVASVYRSLSRDEQASAVVLTPRYTQASAINFFGKALQLPSAYSGHMTHYLWGPPPTAAAVIIAYAWQSAELEPLCGELTRVAEIVHPLASPRENHLPVYVCRQPRVALPDVWSNLKRYYH